jgi:hypothetical protein
MEVQLVYLVQPDPDVLRAGIVEDPDYEPFFWDQFPHTLN